MTQVRVSPARVVEARLAQGHVSRLAAARFLGLALLALSTGCSKQFDFDLPIAEAGNTSVGGVGSTASTAGGTRANSSSRGGGSGAGGAATTTSSASSGNASYPNVGECNHHCASHGVVCATEWLTCAECSADADCTRVSRRRCDVVLHRCFECGVDQDCATGSVCDKSSRHCVVQCGDGVVTTSGSDDSDVCPTATTCNEPIERCVSCATNGDCATSSQGKYCQLSMLSCVGCLTDANCAGSTPYCDPVEFSCVACRDARDCTSGACNPTSHQCE